MRTFLESGQSVRRFQTPAAVLCTSLLWTAALLTTGCEGAGSKAAPGRASATQPADVAPITNTDACATRLHDLCGPLLLYYATRQDLPMSLDQLAGVPGFENVRDFTCPVSGQRYIYNPSGIAGLDPGSRVIIYDPAPSHSGIRWGVSILEPRPGAPLVAKVIGLPESRFAGGKPAPAGPLSSRPAR